MRSTVPAGRIWRPRDVLQYLPAHHGQLGNSFVSAALVVAINALAAFVALLRFDRQRRDRARFQPLDRDRLAGLLAIAVGAVFDALQRRVDLGDQLALPIAGAQFDGPVGLRGGAVGEVGMISGSRPGDAGASPWPP